MLIQTDKSKLGDGFVKGDELYWKLYEETDAGMEQYRLHDQEEMKNEAFKSGHRMHSSELIARIHRIAPHVQVRKGAFDGFYTLWVPNSDPEFQDDDRKGHQYIQAAFYVGWLPEFTFVKVDQNNQIKSVQEGGVQKGWRTILIRLLEFGVVSWKQVIEEFGDATGTQASKWRQATLKFRI